MFGIKRLCCCAALILGACRLDGQPAPPPIIDLHLHATEAEAQGPPPMGMCPGRADGFPATEHGRSCAETFIEAFKKPPCE